jgi:ferrous iron transport protein A
MDISQLVPGDCLRLLSFGQTEVAYRRRLLSLGLTLGTELRVLRIAPFGCPVQIAFRGTELILRKKEAQYLQWERV